jgi:exodeoxyribonuclease VII small subunit
VSEELTYERALELLDQKLKSLEDGDLSLDEALSTVDEARTYLRICEQRLEEARRRIEVRPDTAPAEEPR